MHPITFIATVEPSGYFNGSITSRPIPNREYHAANFFKRTYLFRLLSSVIASNRSKKDEFMHIIIRSSIFN